MYVILWEFGVDADNVDAFLAAYRSDGAWTTRFVTIDRWRAADDFVRFQHKFGTEYRNLDTQLEGLTFSERRLGAFASES